MLVACCLLVVAGCRKESRDAEKTVEQAAAPGPDGAQPQFALTTKTPGALFTWVDKDGSFQIADSAAAVPSHARGTVRVIVEGKPPGNPSHVYVTDLRHARLGETDPETALTVRKMKRSDWEKIGFGAREARVSALRPKKEPAPAPGSAGLDVDAIIYGADWCKPCHLAEDYLKSQGARVLKKDIEEDQGAAREMQAKLKGAGMSGSSIPVIDIGGTILRGFSQGSLDAALKRHRAK
jgi:glutaredoxin